MNCFLKFKKIFRFHTSSFFVFADRLIDIKTKEEGVFMSLDTVTCYFTQYGAVAIFVIVLLEYMNLPGFPAGVIMPLSGVMAARGISAFGRHDHYAFGGRGRKLDFVRGGVCGRQCAAGKVFGKISQAPSSH